MKLGSVDRDLLGNLAVPGYFSIAFSVSVSHSPGTSLHNVRKVGDRP